MVEKTNVEKLEEAGVLDPTEMSPEHIEALNANVTEEELDVLIRVSKKIKMGPFKADPDSAAL